MIYFNIEIVRIRDGRVMENPLEEKRALFNSLHTLRGRWKEGTFREILDDWRWIFTYSKRYKLAILFYTLLGIVSTSFGLAASVAGKITIDIITGHDSSRLGLMIAIMVGSAAFSLLFSSAINRISTKLSIDINNDIQADIFDQIIDVDWQAINRYSSGDLLNRFNSDVSTVSKNAISWLPSIVIALYNFIATFALIWHYNKVMSLLSFASAPVMLLLSKYLIRKQREYANRMKQTGSEMMGFEVETFYNFDTIKSFGIMGNYGKKLRDWQKRLKAISLEYNLFSIKTNVFLRLSNAFNSVVGIVPAFLSSSVSAHRIRELIELPREKHLPETQRLQAMAEQGVEVRMDDLSFAYTEDKQVIVSSSFRASPGEIVALVGPSGEGKTTMIRLALGLIHPDEGTAYLQTGDGTQVACNADSRALFSYVPQGNAILSGTIAENLRMVKEDADDEEIIEALKIACAWDFVSQMPETIHSKLGERGRGLSEGQAQRIAIARAVLRDAPILLLDEATSALDVTTERQVLRNIIRQRPNKTCIVTTHRPTVLSMCQRVYRVIDKRVTELSEEESSRMAMDF